MWSRFCGNVSILVQFPISPSFSSGLTFSRNLYVGNKKKKKKFKFKLKGNSQTNKYNHWQHFRTHNPCAYIIGKRKEQKPPINMNFSWIDFFKCVGKKIRVYIYHLPPIMRKLLYSWKRFCDFYSSSFRIKAMQGEIFNTSFTLIIFF